jgi:hypothetical protein
MTSTVSIGIMRDDGEFAILATLNNNDGHLSDALFAKQVIDLTNWYNEQVTDTVQAIARQDAPDYVSTDDECW